MRLRSSLGSGHAELNLVISELSTLRQSLKDSIAIQQTGELTGSCDVTAPVLRKYNLCTLGQGANIACLYFYTLISQKLCAGFAMWNNSLHSTYKIASYHFFEYATSLI